MGHKRFKELLKLEEELHNKKNADYASEENPLRNFKHSALLCDGLITDGMTDVKIALIYMMKQVDAVVKLIANNEKGDVEGVCERLQDISVYSKLIQILYEEQS